MAFPRHFQFHNIRLLFLTFNLLVPSQIVNSAPLFSAGLNIPLELATLYKLNIKAGPLGLAFGDGLGALEGLSSIFGDGAAGLGALTGGLGALTGGVGSVGKGVTSALGSTVGGVRSTVGETAGSLVQAMPLNAATGVLGDVTGGVGSTLKDVTSSLTGAISFPMMKPKPAT